MSGEIKNLEKLKAEFFDMIHHGLITDIRYVQDTEDPHLRIVISPSIPSGHSETIANFVEHFSKACHSKNPHFNDQPYHAEASQHGCRSIILWPSNIEDKSLRLFLAEASKALTEKAQTNPLLGCLRYKTRLSDDRLKRIPEVFQDILLLKDRDNLVTAINEIMRHYPSSSPKSYGVMATHGAMYKYRAVSPVKPGDEQNPIATAKKLLASVSQKNKAVSPDDEQLFFDLGAFVSYAEKLMDTQKALLAAAR